MKIKDIILSLHVLSLLTFNNSTFIKIYRKFQRQKAINRTYPSIKALVTRSNKSHQTVETVSSDNLPM